MNVRAFERFRMVVQRVLDFVDDEVGHLPVDISSEFNESSLDAGLLGLPGEIKRIDGNAVAAKARAGIKRH